MTARTYVVVNAYSARNVGDAAIVLQTAALLTAQGASHVVNSTRYAREDKVFYARRGIEVMSSPIPFPVRGTAPSTVRFATLISGLAAAVVVAAVERVAAGRGLALARRAGLEGLVALCECDRAVVCGGGYFYSSQRRLNLTLAHALAQILLASALGKQPLMMPQSVGPLPKHIDRWMVRRALRKVRPIIVRDAIAESEARSLFPGLPNAITRCPDIAFYGRARTTRATMPAVAKRVGVVVMDWTWAREVEPGRALNTYIYRLMDVVEQMTHSGYHVTLFGHSRVPEQGQDDLAVAKCLAAALRERSVVAEVATDAREPELLMQAFDKLDLVIGTRLHSCILALTVGTPAIALAYQPKAVGTYAMLGLSDLCRDVESFEVADIIGLTEAILAPASTMQARIDEAVEEAHNAITRLYAQLLRP